MEDDRRALISVERNIANIERSLSASVGGGGGGRTVSSVDGAVVRNHHSEAARGLGKLFPGGRSSSLGRDLQINDSILFFYVVKFALDSKYPVSSTVSLSRVGKKEEFANLW